MEINPKEFHKEHGIWPRFCYGCNEWVDQLYGDNDSPTELCLECYTYHGDELPSE
jgi:hypothetical protein